MVNSVPVTSPTVSNPLVRQSSNATVSPRNCLVQGPKTFTTVPTKSNSTSGAGHRDGDGKEADFELNLVSLPVFQVRGYGPPTGAVIPEAREGGRACAGLVDKGSNE